MATLSIALWTDVEVSHPGVRCVGQHLILHCSDDTSSEASSESFNPNQFFGQDFFHSFIGYDGRKRDKCPFATAHFMANALGALYPRRGTPGYAAFAHADGSWLRVQLFRLARSDVFKGCSDYGSNAVLCSGSGRTEIAFTTCSKICVLSGCRERLPQIGGIWTRYHFRGLI
jgi:hypothetical protein